MNIIMKVSEFVVENLAKAVCGDAGYTPYLSGPNLVRLFNRFGYDDIITLGLHSQGWHSCNGCDPVVM